MPFGTERSAQCTLHKMNFLGCHWLKLSFGTKWLKISLSWSTLQLCQPKVQYCTLKCLCLKKTQNEPFMWVNCCIKRQLIQSEQSKVECCFSWAYTHWTTQNWETYFGPGTIFSKMNQNFWFTRLQTKYVPHTECSKLNFTITRHLTWQGYGLEGPRFKIWYRQSSVQTNSAAHPASYSVNSTGSFLGVGLLECEGNHV
jgi:hypothetical protein